jgi:hypothetical protein
MSSLISSSAKFISEKEISFRANAAGDHGYVNRSSAIFYFIKNNSINTTISFLNYWPLKRDINVAVFASLREMSGALIKRQLINFESGMCCNLKLENFSTLRDFEGSLEIEVFSTSNMVIPFSAIVASYQTGRSLSVVHTYGRIYSPHEIEEGRAIAYAAEGCWTIRDNAESSSFCVFHNGANTQQSQVIVLNVINKQGVSISKCIPFEEIKPYETIVVKPCDFIPNLNEFLGGAEGFAKLKFNINGAFPRMLVGHVTANPDMQVTHSNFDYSVKKTDTLDKASVGYMYVPSFDGFEPKVIVYPDSAVVNYELNDGLNLVDQKISISSGYVTNKYKKPATLKFKSLSDEMPSRLVTSLVFERPGFLAAECSLGVLTNIQPKKRMWWGPYLKNESIRSQIVVHMLPEIFGVPDDNVEISIKFYSSKSLDSIEKNLYVKDFSNGMATVDIDNDIENFSGADFGYFVFYSEFGGFTCYTKFDHVSGSMSFEHAF